MYLMYYIDDEGNRIYTMEVKISDLFANKSGLNFYEHFLLDSLLREPRIGIKMALGLY